MADAVLIPELPPSGAPAETGGFFPGSGGMGQQWLEYYTPAEWRALNASTLNQVARKAEARQQTIAGAGSARRILYGTVPRVGAAVAVAVKHSGNRLALLVVWGEGECGGVVQVYESDRPLPLTGITATHYTGTSSQSVDPTLVAAFLQSGKVYNDALPGVCYSVFDCVAGSTSGFPIFTADVQGLLVRTTSAGARSFQDCAAYCIADFIESTTYGMRKAVEWDSVAITAAAADELVGGERKRILNLALDSSQPVETWLATLCDYAGCKAIPEGESYRLVPDARITPQIRLTSDDEQRVTSDGEVRVTSDVANRSRMSFTTANIVANSLKLSGRSMRDSPTVVEIVYTDISGGRARDSAPVTAQADGVSSGAVPRRVSRISMPGITRYSEANRYAIERVNAAVLNDMTITFKAFDDVLRLQVGDLIDVTHPRYFTEKLFRVAKLDESSPGRWDLSATEFDPAVYSSVVVSGPSVTDTDIDSPASPPAMSAITLTEEYYQLRDGTWSSRIRATWTASTYSLISQYVIDVRQAGAIVASGIAPKDATTWVTGAVQESVPYQIDVRIATTIAAGTAASATITPLGNLLPPADVESLDGFEAGGRVFLSWPAAADISALLYEIRYWPVGDTWSDGTLIDRIAGLRYVAEALPTGTWVLGVKARDTVGLYSTNAATRTIEITSDASAFVVDRHVFTAPVLTNMYDQTMRDGTHRYTTDFGDGIGYGADDTNNAVGTFGDSLVADPLATPHTAGTSSFVTESWDMGSSKTGNFVFLPSYTAIDGTADVYVETSPDNSTWTQWAGGSGRTSARYVRGRLETTGVLLVTGEQAARIDVVARRETGSVAVGASGPTTVTLSGMYATAKTLQLTPAGTAARIAVYDNVSLDVAGTNQFDVYLFDAAGAQVAGDVSWIFEGI